MLFIIHCSILIVQFIANGSRILIVLKIIFCCLYLNLLGDTHGNVMGSVQDSRGNFRRLQTLQNNMERVLAEKFKELDTVNTQLKVLGVKSYEPSGLLLPELIPFSVA